jgi:hypothetical protein
MRVGYDRITTTIEREWLAQIIAGTKKGVVVRTEQVPTALPLGVLPAVPYSRERASLTSKQYGCLAFPISFHS